MAKLSGWGVIVMPASPGFYNLPETMEDLIDFVVSRILDHLGKDNKLTKRWTGEELQ
jgi:flavin prenyltransferase